MALIKEDPKFVFLVMGIYIGKTEIPLVIFSNRKDAENFIEDCKKPLAYYGHYDTYRIHPIKLFDTYKEKEWMREP